MYENKDLNDLIEEDSTDFPVVYVVFVSIGQTRTPIGIAGSRSDAEALGNQYRLNSIYVIPDSIYVIPWFVGFLFGDKEL